MFTDPRVWAAHRWFGFRAEALDFRRQALQLTRAAPARPPHGRQRAGRERTPEKDKEVKLYNALLAETNTLIARRRERLVERYGNNPFPELESRVAAIRDLVPDRMTLTDRSARTRAGLADPQRGPERLAWLLCAEMEKIVLRDVSAYTSRMIADCEREARERAAQARELLEKGRERLGLLEEQWQGERAEREAEAVPQPPPAPTARVVDRRADERAGPEAFAI